jgi:hypothetical protein
MKYFYRIMHWLTAWDCDFARNTGRSTEHVAYLAERRDEWALLAWKQDYPMKG